MASNKLIDKKDFQAVFAQLNKINTRYLRVFYHTNHLTCARIGIIIAKSIVKKAVDRNLIRRITRESFRIHKKMLKGLDIVAVIRSECKPRKAANCSLMKQKINKKALRDDVDQLWQQILVKCSRLG